MGWVGTGALQFHQKWQAAKKQLTEALDMRLRSPWTQTPEACKKTFSTSFVPQPVENTTLPHFSPVYTDSFSRVVKKIESSRRDGKSNRGDFLIFVFLMLEKLSYVHSEKLVHLSE